MDEEECIMLDKWQRAGTRLGSQVAENVSDVYKCVAVRECEDEQ